MNLYIVVEGGKGEKLVYREWIPTINPSITEITNIADFSGNNFFIVSGEGYPQYFEIIDNAIEDVNMLRNISRLVISIDAEDMSYEEKLEEIEEFISDKPCSAEVRIVIQFFCFETWALGNRKIGPHSSKLTPLLKTYKTFFNVLTEDPAQMPAYPLEKLNRAQFAAKYLKKLLNARNRTYTKHNPQFIANPTYFGHVRKRYEDTNHIQSLNCFIDAFSPP